MTPIFKADLPAASSSDSPELSAREHGSGCWYHRLAHELRPRPEAVAVQAHGVGAYVLALADRLPALAPDDRFYFFSASLKDRYPQLPWPTNVTLVDRRLPVRP